MAADGGCDTDVVHRVNDGCTDHQRTDDKGQEVSI